MCGRYTVTASLDELVETFEVTRVTDEDFGLPRYNVAPTQRAPVVIGTLDEGRRLGLMRWGLVPFWADDPSIGGRMINARSESIGAKPAFREAFRRRRCLVPVDGFYEWRRPQGGDGPKRPFRIHRPDERPFALAGLWERWRPGPDAGDGDELLTFTILTTRPNAEVAPLHDRMPVVLPPESWDAWADVDTPGDRLRTMLGPPPDGTFGTTEVSTRVNRPQHDDPACIEPV